MMRNRSWLVLGLVLLGMGLVGVLVAVTPVRASGPITVTTMLDILDGNDGKCSLREAVIAANTDTASGPAVGECPAGSGLDVIGFSVTGTAYLDGPLPSITQSVTINGPGTDQLSLYANFDLSKSMMHFGGVSESFSLAHIRITSNGVPGGIHVGAGSLAMTNLVITGMGPPSGLVISFANATAIVANSTFSNNHSPSGAGIYNLGGVLLLKDSTVANNGTGFMGGGILNTGNATIVNSTISGNTTGGGFGDSNGAGISNSGVLTLTNSTVSGNQAIDPNANGYGGGIYNSGTLIVINTTIAGNAANGAGGGLRVVSGTVTLRNTIIADTITGDDCSQSGGTITNSGANFVEDNSCGFVGGSAAMLAPLQDHGGPTLTHAPLAGSPAIDAGNPAGCTDASGAPLTTDQRGYTRPADGDGNGTAACDIGAFEYGASLPVMHQLFLPLIRR